MQTTQFDQIAATFGQSHTRRGMVRLLGAALAAGGLGYLGVAGSEAKRRGKKKNKRKKQQPAGTQTPGTQAPGGQTPGGQNQGLPPGTRCQSSAQCTAGYICAVPVNGSNSDLYCSGGPGAICGAPNGDGGDTAPFCAVGHRCTASGGGCTCQPTPDE